ncbi:hypothetical protein VTJ83DRAFT_1239 [Remersonia thermophila]|uniref:1-acyl-sn-glycerol-3-phosphate acyltransferase n=1 Tax=Remersonia thermophila TaxID=72144 RepID=A0ABR4DNH5_9PEZI
MAILAYVGWFLAGYVALTVFFYMLSLVIPKAAFVARALAMYLAAAVSSLFGVYISIFFRIIGCGQIAQWACARCFKWLGFLATGVTFEVEDPKGHLEKVRPAVFLGNHQTELDVLMLGCMFPKYCSVTAKASLRAVPFLGWFMALSGTVFLNRANSKDARQALAGAAEQMRTRRHSVYIFPEGTRSYTKEPTLLPFKKGAFHLAVQAQVPIVPVVVANYSHVLWIKGRIFNSGRVPVKVLDPIPTTGLTAADVDDLARTTRELMLKELIALTEKARGQAVENAPQASSEPATARTTGAQIKVAA